MTEEILTVTCACGWQTAGSEDDVVAATTEHGRVLHNMSATREQVLAMAVSEDESGRAKGGPTESRQDARIELQPYRRRP